MDHSGAAPGRIVAVRHCTPMRPWRRSSVASTPALISEDLPLPDGPMTKAKWVRPGW